MTREFRLRTVRDYDHIPRGMGTPERELKIKCCEMILKDIEERLGKDHPWYAEFQARKAKWESP